MLKKSGPRRRHRLARWALVATPLLGVLLYAASPASLRSASAVDDTGIRGDCTVATYADIDFQKQQQAFSLPAAGDNLEWHGVSHVIQEISPAGTMSSVFVQCHFKGFRTAYDDAKVLHIRLFLGREGFYDLLTPLDQWRINADGSTYSAATMQGSNLQEVGADNLVDSMQLFLAPS